MGIQETVPAMVMKTLKIMLGVIIGIVKFVIIPYVIPAIRHGIKHGWIFIPLGITISMIIHGVLYSVFYENSIPTTRSHVISIPFYGIMIYVGIKLRTWKFNLNQNRDSANLYTNPNLPEDLYEHEE